MGGRCACHPFGGGCVLCVLGGSEPSELVVLLQPPCSQGAEVGVGGRAEGVDDGERAYSHGSVIGHAGVARALASVAKLRENVAEALPTPPLNSPARAPRPAPTFPSAKS